MDADRFDALLRQWPQVGSRRALARALAAIALAGSATAFRDDSAEAKRCGPCRKRKKGRCRGNKPTGTPCGGVCQECRNGACVSKANGAACGDVPCRSCQDGTCATSPDNASCDGNGRCLSGACNAPPTCAPSLEACTPANAGACCSGECSVFNFPPPVGPKTLCNKGSQGDECVQNRDCASDACVGYHCQ